MFSIDFSSWKQGLPPMGQWGSIRIVVCDVCILVFHCAFYQSPSFPRCITTFRTCEAACRPGKMDGMKKTVCLRWILSSTKTCYWYRGYFPNIFTINRKCTNDCGESVEKYNKHRFHTGILHDTVEQLTFRYALWCVSMWHAGPVDHDFASRFVVGWQERHSQRLLRWLVF